MKIEKAIEHLKDINVIAKTRHMCRSMDGELEDGEIQVYRKRFESVKMAIKALEKQIPKKLIYKENGNIECPSCNCEALRYHNYCWNCGQASKWGGATDGDTSTD